MTSPARPAERRGGRRPRVVYSTVDVIRLVASLLALAVVVVLVNFGESALAGAEADLIRLADRIPKGVTELAVMIVQWVAVFAPVVASVALLTRRQFRRLMGAMVAAVAGGVVGRWIMVDLLELRVDRFQITGALSDGVAFPSAPFMAAIAALVAADSPWMSTRWRQAARGWLGVLLALRLFSGSSGLRELIVATSVGWVVGSAVGVLLGAPDRRPPESSVTASLTRLGVSVGSARHIRSSGGRHRYLATRTAGDDLWVEVAARDGWQTMLPGRLYRALRFRDPADGRPFAGLRELTEHEALVALKASTEGVPTPPVEAIGEVDVGGYLLAFRSVEGSTMATLVDPDPALLDRIWQLVVRLRTARIAHRDLGESSVLVTPDGQVMALHFGAADLTGDERVLSGDIAEVLAWTSERFGVEDAVDASLAALGPGVVARALPRLQPLALSRATRSSLGKDTLSEIADRVRHVTGADEPDLAPIERIKPRAAFSALMAVVAINALVPQLAGFSKVWGELGDAQPSWIVAALLFSLLTYLGAALALSGSIAEPLPFGPNLAVQVASSFASIAAPAQIGGVALKGRFLQRRGTDPAVAVAAIGLNTVAALVVHVAILVSFVVWAGNSDLSNIRLPSPTTVGLVLGSLVVVLGVTAALPVGRGFLQNTVVPAIKRSVQGVTDVARRPVRLAGLIGGSAVITLAYVGSLAASVQAFNGGLPFSAVAIVFLLGAIVQSVAPTPGGLGAAEAAYIGGLTAIGLASERAVAAVLLFRLVTFWLPVVPGWIAMTWLQRSEAL